MQTRNRKTEAEAPCSVQPSGIGKRRPAPRLATALLTCALVLAIALPSCTKSGATSANTSKPNTAQAKSQPQNASPQGAQLVAQSTVFPVSVTEAVRGELNDYIAVTGGIQAANTVDVYADTSGTLVKLNVHLGEYVKQNEVVAEVDPSRPGQNFVPSPVRAPISGAITSLPVDLGARITQAIPVAQISTIHQLQIRTQVAERYIGLIRLREPAFISLQPYPDETFQAYVSELSPVVDPQTRTMDVTLKFAAADPRIKAGMYAEIKIITQHKKDVVKIPADSIVERGDSLFIFVAGPNGAAIKRNVKVGIRIDGKAEIIAGVEAGEKVIVRGQTLLEDGAHVKIVDEVPSLPKTDIIH